MIQDLLNVFRPLRWYRNGFMLLGVILAVRIESLELTTIWLNLTVAFFSLCLIASGNYGINEIFDAESDKYHPVKKQRAIPSGKISKRTVCIVSICFYLAGFSCILPFSNHMLLISAFLMLISGILYNIKPFRFKDRAYLDFTFEALNNPIRLLVGWYAVAPDRIVPSSFLLAFWAIGIFLMAAKRFGELRFIDDIEISSKYRKSLHHYTEKKLLFAMIAGICSFNYMFGALSFKYSIDLITILPFLIIWIIWFFALSYEKDTVVKDPEKIFQKKKFLGFTIFLFCLFFALLFSGDRIMIILKQ